MSNVGCLWHGGSCKMKCKYGEMLFQGCGYEKCCRQKVIYVQTTTPKSSAPSQCVSTVGILQISSLIIARKLWNV